MPTQIQRSIKSSPNHISRARLINFGFEFEPLSESETEHFDSCRDCRSEFRVIMEKLVLPANCVFTKAS